MADLVRVDDRSGLVPGLVPRSVPGSVPRSLPRSDPGRGRTVRLPVEIAPVRVASIPQTHVYVRALDHPGVQRLRDPSGDDHRTPLFLDPAWIRSHEGDFDVLHVQFGFEFYPPERLAAVCDALADIGVPLVYTCHDLRNPNHATRELHDAGLAVWMERAAAIVTLTPWAAEHIRTTFGRDAVVLAHPHVVPMSVMESIPRVDHPGEFRVGLHLKSLRPNMCPHQALDGVVAALGHGVRARIDVHPDVLDPASPVHDRVLVDRLLGLVADADSRVDLHVHQYYGDDELWHHLAAVDAFVLPYAFGTHSGLLEACRDVGTAVIAPDIGGYSDQGAHHTFAADEVDGIDVVDLARAVRASATAGRPRPVPVAERRRQRRDVAAAHLQLYRDVMSGRGGTG